jgi:predicted TIM-barrel fold metal-dependent hydrolase
MSDKPTLSRREVLTGLSATAASIAFTRGLQGSQQPPASAPVARRILDLHHHFASPRWINRMAESQRQGWQGFQEYTPARAIETMDEGGTQTAFISCTEPGVWFGDDFERERQDAILLSRDMNEYGARMVSDYKGRFGLFAVLPLPDIDASLKEIEYGFDTLKADGVGLLTSYGNMWLGDTRLRPVFDELNRRGAIVYTHPTDAPCCHYLANATPATLEWFTDTARSIMSLIAEPTGPRSGGAGVLGRGRAAGARQAAPGAAPPAQPTAATRYNNIKFIWSHAGGTLLGAVSRVVGGVDAEGLAGTPPTNSRLYHVRRFYYDTAASANPIAMQGLKTLLGGTSHIVFGTDLPYGTSAQMRRALQSVGFSAAEVAGIERDNALTILPGYRAR